MIELLPLLLAIARADESATPSVGGAVARGVEIVLERQEGPDEREWPYEGVYRVQGSIPIGYRIGGTALCGLMLLQAPPPAPDAAPDERRATALWRATEFICEGPHQPLMAHDFEARYDVRGWGYTYGLAYLLALKKAGRIPDDLDDAAEAAIDFYLAGIAATEIPVRGGWNYARRAGFDAPGPHAPFMTAPTLMTLFEAKRQGYEVDAELVERGLAALERSRTESGGVHYSGRRGAGAVPGATGRMLVTETALHLAGRGDLARVRGAVDAFFTHWEVLEARGEAQRFEAMLAEYRRAPEVTRRRLYLETMEQVLPNIDKMIVEPDTVNVMPVLPVPAGPSVVPAPAPAPQESRSQGSEDQQ